MRGQQNPDNVKAAIGFFEQALQKDAGFARAYAGISDGSLRMYRVTRDSKWAEKALSAAQQARGLDDKLVEAHISLGSIYQATGKASEAIAELTLAAELTPNSDDVFRRLARAYLATGRGDQAIENYKKAIAVNPYYWVATARPAPHTCSWVRTPPPLMRSRRSSSSSPGTSSGHTISAASICSSDASTKQPQRSARPWNSNRPLRPTRTWDRVRLQRQAQ